MNEKHEQIKIEAKRFQGQELAVHLSFFAQQRINAGQEVLLTFPDLSLVDNVIEDFKQARDILAKELEDKEI